MGRKLQLPNEPLQIGSRIRDERIRQGLTLDDLAASTGVHKGQISRFCNGDFKTWSDNLQLVCKKLQISEVAHRDDTSSALDEVLKEVRIGWEGAGKRRKSYENAIIAIAKLANAD